MGKTYQSVCIIGYAAVGLLLAAIAATGCASRATRVSFFRLADPDSDCVVKAETSAAYGIGGIKLILSCSGQDVDLTRINGDFYPGSATVAWMGNGETHLLVCNRWAPDQPEIVSFLRPSGRVQDSNSRGYQSLATKILSESSELSGRSPAFVISGYCRSAEAYDRFLKAHPLLRLNWFGEPVREGQN